MGNPGLVNLISALEYADVGWRVLPLYGVLPVDATAQFVCECAKGANCHSPGKHPRISDWTRLATTNEQQIRQWWSDYPLSNIGIATGADSKIVVLDIDPKSGGVDSMNRIVAEHGQLPPTLVVQTGSGGWHYYFKHPGGRLGNVQGSGTVASPIGAGLDFRGDGGMVVAPPSLHVTGGAYRWVSRSTLLEMPQWLLTKLTEHKKSSQAASFTSQVTVADDGTIPEGQRHRTLIAWAGSMRSKGLGYAAIQAALTVENQTRFATPKEQSEVDRIVKWICRFPAGEVPSLAYLVQNILEDPSKVALDYSGLVSVDEVATELDQLYQIGAQPGFSTGISVLDELYSLQPGDLTVLLAAPSSGKTTFMNTLAANVATEHGWKVVICSTENRVPYLMADIASMLVGQTMYGNFPEYKMPLDEKEWVTGFLREHFRFVVPRSDTPLTLQWVSSQAAAWGADLLTIDPFGSLDLTVDRQQNDSRAIRNLLHGFLQPFLKENKMHCILAVHTTKLSLDGNGDIRMPNPYDATDSAGFYNAADGLISLRRPASRGGQITEGEVQKVRDRFSGKLGRFDLNFDFKTSRYTGLKYTAPGFGDESEEVPF